jgi:hypothetical protein
MVPALMLRRHRCRQPVQYTDAPPVLLSPAAQGYRRPSYLDRHGAGTPELPAPLVSRQPAAAVSMPGAHTPAQRGHSALAFAR